MMNFALMRARFIVTLCNQYDIMTFKMLKDH